MPNDKAAYLAAHYLTADTKPSKKRKRKHTSKDDGLLIADDNDDWGSGSSKNRRNADDEDGPATVAGTSSEFRKSKKSGWKTVGAPVPTDTKDQRDAAEAAADAVLAAAAAETAAARDEDDAAPVIADNDGDVDMLADGSYAGLQSASAVTAQQEKRRRREREELARLDAERKEAGDQEEEVVLRDATGRRIDVSMRRAEARRAALEAEKAEEAKARLLKGEVQADQAKARREALEDAALMPLARGINDTDLNREQKAEERWNDPMAQFLAADTGEPGKKKKGGVKGRRPTYKGAAPPNRYGIKPGYRWDGVDRGTGFEAERFKAINRRERNKALDYSWQQDV